MKNLGDWAFLSEEICSEASVPSGKTYSNGAILLMIDSELHITTVS